MSTERSTGEWLDNAFIAFVLLGVAIGIAYIPVTVLGKTLLAPFYLNSAYLADSFPAHNRQAPAPLAESSITSRDSQHEAIPEPQAALGYSGRTQYPNFNIDLATPAYYETPIDALIGKMHRSMEIPLWNPYQGIGLPLLGQYSTRALFPYQVVQDVSPVAWWDYFLLGRLWLAAFFTYLFIRRLGTVGSVAFLGGLLYGLSGAFTWFVNLQQLTNVAMMLPALMWSLERAAALRRGVDFALASVLAALVLYAGQPEVAFFVFALAFAYYLFRSFHRPEASKPSWALVVGWATAQIALVFGVALLIAAPQVIPFLSLVANGYTTHGAGGDLALRSPTPYGWLTAIFQPGIFQKEFVTPELPMNGIWDWLGGYSGAAAIVLTMAGLLGPRHPLGRHVLFFTCVAVVVLFKNAGIAPFNVLSALPISVQAWSQRWAGPVWAFSFAVAAALSAQILGSGYRQGYNWTFGGWVVKAWRGAIRFAALLPAVANTPGRQETHSLWQAVLQRSAVLLIWQLLLPFIVVLGIALVVARMAGIPMQALAHLFFACVFLLVSATALLPAIWHWLASLKRTMRTILTEDSDYTSARTASIRGLGLFMIAGALLIVPVALVLVHRVSTSVTPLGVITVFGAICGCLGGALYVRPLTTLSAATWPLRKATIVSSLTPILGVAVGLAIVLADARPWSSVGLVGIVLWVLIAPMTVLSYVWFTRNFHHEFDKWRSATTNNLRRVLIRVGWSQLLWVLPAAIALRLVSARDAAKPLPALFCLGVAAICASLIYRYGRLSLKRLQHLSAAASPRPQIDRTNQKTHLTRSACLIVGVAMLLFLGSFARLSSDSFVPRSMMGAAPYMLVLLLVASLLSISTSRPESLDALRRLFTRDPSVATTVSATLLTGLVVAITVLRVGSHDLSSDGHLVLLPALVAVGTTIMVLVVFARALSESAAVGGLILLALTELTVLIPTGYSPGHSYLKLIPWTCGLLAALAFARRATKISILMGTVGIAAVITIDQKAQLGLPERGNPFEESQYVRYIKSHAGHGRMVAGGGLNFPNTSSALGLFDIRYINSVTPAWLERYVTKYLRGPEHITFDHQWFTGKIDARVDPLMSRLGQNFSFSPRALSFLGVKYLAVPNFGNNGLLPMADATVWPKNQRMPGFAPRSIRASGELTDRLAEHAVDGDPQTYWSTDRGTRGPDWFAFSFPQAAVLESISLLTRSANLIDWWPPSGYIVEAANREVPEEGDWSAIAYVGEVNFPMRIASNWWLPEADRTNSHWVHICLPRAGAFRHYRLLTSTGGILLNRHRRDAPVAFAELKAKSAMPLTEPTVGLSEPVTERCESMRDALSQAKNLFQRVYEDSHVTIYELTNILARAYVVRELRRANNFEEAQDIAMSRDFQLAREAVMEGATGATVGLSTRPVMSGHELSDEVRITSYRANEVELLVRLTEPGLVVLTDLWMPGWHGSLNGKEVPIHRVNGLVRGIWVERPGDHQISMKFAPPGWYLSVYAATAALMLALIVSLAWRRQLR